MANRFSPPQQQQNRPSDLDYLLGVADLGLELYKIKQAKDIRREDMTLKQNEQAMMGRQLDQADTRIRLDTEKGAREQKQLEYTAPHKATLPISPGEWAVTKARMMTAGKRVGFPIEKSMAPLIETLDQMAAEGVSPAYMYKYTQANWETFKKPIIDDAQKALEQLMQNADKYPNQEIIASRAQRYQYVITAVSRPEFVGMLMPKADEYIQQEKENEKRLITEHMMKAGYFNKKDTKGMVDLNPPAAKSLDTWVTPDGKTINLPPGMEPPAGAVPYSTGMEIDVGPGGTQIRTNVPSRTKSGLTKPVQAEVETKLLAASEGLRRVTSIVDGFEPKYFDKPHRAKQAWNNLAEGWGLKQLNETEAMDLTKMTEYGRQAIEDINLYIKDITGAAMSIQEADRLKLARPDFGSAWWKGDGPTKFKAKMLDVQKSSKMAIARLNYVKNNGFTIVYDKDGLATHFLDSSSTPIDLDDVPDLIEERGKALEKEGLSEAQVTERLNEEFGLVGI